MNRGDRREAIFQAKEGHANPADRHFPSPGPGIAVGDLRRSGADLHLHFVVAGRGSGQNSVTGTLHEESDRRFKSPGRSDLPLCFLRLLL